MKTESLVDRIKTGLVDRIFVQALCNINCLYLSVNFGAMKDVKLENGYKKQLKILLKICVQAKCELALTQSTSGKDWTKIPY